MKKKIALVLAGLLLLPVAFIGVGIALTMAGLAPFEASADLPGGARLVKDGYVSMGLLHAGDDVVLIDCGFDPTGAALLSELSRAKKSPDAVKAIFLTHGHPDHVAGCHLFHHAEVYAFAADVAMAAGHERPKGPLTRLLPPPPDKRVTVTKTLTDGQQVTVGPLTVTAYAVPGHTGGSAALLAQGLLFMGDSAALETGGTLRAAPWLMSDDSDDNLASLIGLAKGLKAAGTQVEVTVFSHSAPSRGLEALQAFARKHEPAPR